MIEVLKPGLFSTIQDIGRTGYVEFGMPTAGVMDEDAFRLANWLVGNDLNSAVLEITLNGPKLVFHCKTFIAITGAKMNPRINGIPVSMYETINIERGDLLEFGELITGCRTYISVSGGITTKKKLGSRATYTYAEIGGIDGTVLKKGNKIPISEVFKCELKKVPDNFQLKYASLLTIRVIAGPEEDKFEKKALEKFYKTEFIISNQSNRMGYKLSGKEIKLKKTFEMLSSGIVNGTIQIPQDGNPIILLADGQTTGGYPRIANIISVDIPFLGQQKPGDKIRFKKIGVNEAQSLLSNKENSYSKLFSGR